MSELWTEDRVNYWIESGVEIPQPKEKAKHISVNTVSAQGA